MANVYSCVLVLRTGEGSGEKGHDARPRLIVSNRRPLTAAETSYRRAERNEAIAHGTELMHAPEALAGPALPALLRWLEFEREGVHRLNGEIHAVHRLACDWAAPTPHVCEASALLPNVTFEMSHLSPEDDEVGASIYMGGEMLAWYAVDLDAAVAAAKELTSDELAEKPPYLTELRWFVTLQAQREAGLRAGQAVSLPPPSW